MRLCITGASGNVGTALLGALASDPEVEDVVGIARRRPDTTAAPYNSARWQVVDLAMPVPSAEDETKVVEKLAAIFQGMDAVVHLAWMIQPDRNRRLLRRANVVGTRRVVDACLSAGVRHLVCASSVGAYSGVHDDDPRDETWSTRGVPSAHYSVDKAAQERVLDYAESQGLAIARVRPALVFDASAGAEVTRLFLGPMFPARLLRPGALPVVPLPAGLRFQVVHADDLADAYRRILSSVATGPFNVATDGVLRGGDLAEVLGARRRMSLPARALRPAVELAWRAHAVAADPGWMDIAMSAPIMDTERIRAELDWRPRRDARSTLREMITAIADGDGAASAPMRPRLRWPRDQQAPGEIPPIAVPGEGHRLPASIERDIFALYLSDHLTGATGGADRASRMAHGYADTPIGEELARFAAEARRERTFLKELVSSLELPRRRHRQAVAWIGEKIGRLKSNGRSTDSPMTPVLEIELMRGAVAAKLGCWETLADLSPELGFPSAVFIDLAARARAQLTMLQGLHERVAAGAFRVG